MLIGTIANSLCDDNDGNTMLMGEGSVVASPTTMHHHHHHHHHHHSPSAFLHLSTDHHHYDLDSPPRVHKAI